MKKLLYLAIGLIALSACQPEGLAGKKLKLNQKEKELEALKEEIRQLETEIAQLDTTQQGEIKRVPVKVKEMSREVFRHYVEITGLVNSEENVLLSAEASGRVEAILVEEGDLVKKGQLLVRLNDDAIKQQLEEARAAYELSETTYQRRKALWEKDSIGSEIEYLNAQTNFKAAKNRLGQAEARYENTRLKAPVNGRVDNITVNEGEYVGMGTPIVRVVDMTSLEVEAELSENYLKSIDKGDSVIVRIPALDIKQTQAVTFAGQYINPDNRSFTVKVALDNADEMLKPNLLADLSFLDYQNPEALVVPAIAVKQDLKGQFVYVVVDKEGGPQTEKRYVERGRSFRDQTEILSGLEPGDQVVTAGFNEVSPGEEVIVKQ